MAANFFRFFLWRLEIHYFLICDLKGSAEMNFSLMDREKVTAKPGKA